MTKTVSMMHFVSVPTMHLTCDITPAIVTCSIHLNGFVKRPDEWSFSFSSEGCEEYFAFAI